MFLDASMLIFLLLWNKEYLHDTTKLQKGAT